MSTASTVRESFQWVRTKLQTSNTVLAILILFFGYAVRDVWATSDSLATISILTAALVLLVILQVDSRELFRRGAEDVQHAESVVAQAKREKEDALRDLNELLTERGLLLKMVSEEIAGVFTEIGRSIKADRPQEEIRAEIINSILRRICSTFEKNRYPPPGEDRLEHTYFKATLFELSDSQGQQVLRRAYWHYPPTKTPQTQQISVGAHPHATAVICYREQRMIVVEDVESEFIRDGEFKRWEDLRTNQHREYKSMICVPVMWRHLERDEVQFIGVITIDTNRNGYFRDTLEGRGFLDQLLAPFLKAIELCYILYPISR